MISFLTAAMPRSQSSALIYAAAVNNPHLQHAGASLEDTDGSRLTCMLAFIRA